MHTFLGIEDLCAKRDDLHRQILQEEEEKQKIQNDIRILTERLAQVTPPPLPYTHTHNFLMQLNDYALSKQHASLVSSFHFLKLTLKVPFFRFE